MARRKLLWVAGAVVFLLLMVFVAPAIEVCHDVAYVDRNTASMYGYREWPIGLRTGPWTKTSPLETLMETRWPGVVRHRWARCALTGKNLFGSSISFTDYTIQDLAMLSSGALDAWMAQHSENDARILYDFLSVADKDAGTKRADEIVSGFTKQPA